MKSSPAIEDEGLKGPDPWVPLNKMPGLQAGGNQVARSPECGPRKRRAAGGGPSVLPYDLLVLPQEAVQHSLPAPVHGLLPGASSQSASEGLVIEKRQDPVRKR